MTTQIANGFLAVFLGVLIGVLLFVPFVAISYRRNGSMPAGRLIAWGASLVYFLAIWTYTLLPLPDPENIFCVDPVTSLAPLVDDMRTAFTGPGNPLLTSQFLQIALNIVLFVPLGFFVRLLANRGIIVATISGFALSLLVELTQLTGVWGVYECSFRFFDVGDLATNTSGALLGSVLSLVVPRAMRGRGNRTDPETPRPVTRMRRILAMVCDALALGFVSGTVAVVIRAAVLFFGDAAMLNGRVGDIVTVVSTGATSALWLIVILATGSSIGDLTVRLSYAGSPLPTVVARFLRWLGGIAGITVIGLLGVPGSFAESILILVAIIAALVTSKARGLPGLLSRQHLVDSRSAFAAPGA